MKNVALIAILAFIVGNTFGQNFKKGNFVGFHVMTITLNQGVTMDQYIDVMKNKVIPADDKYFECKSYIVKGIRGECVNCIGWVVVWDTEAGRDKFMNPEGGTNEIGKAAMVKLQPFLDELNKLGTWTSTYTDWVVQ